MHVDHVLDKLYKQVESDDDDVLNLRYKVIHDKHTLQISLANIKLMAYCAKERF